MAHPITLSPPEKGRQLVQFKSRLSLEDKAALAAKALSDGHTITEALKRAVRAYVSADDGSAYSMQRKMLSA